MNKNPINKSLTWIPMPGMSFKQVLETLTGNCADYWSHPNGTHMWVAEITNLGTILTCYILKIDKYIHFGKEHNCIYVNRVQESDGPEVYDCPQQILEMCRITNEEWRKKFVELKAQSSA